MSSMGEHSFKRPMTAQEAALAELRSWILTRRILPGAPIRQDAIAEALGVSRVPVREALKILEGEGHVVYKPHRGYTLVQLNVNDLIEIYRIREILEAEAIRRSVPNLGPDEFERMHDAIEEMEKASKEGNIIDLTAANRRFHFTMFEASGMPRLQNLILTLWDSSDPYRSVYFFEDSHRKTVNEEHREIMKLVEAGAVEELLVVLETHRDNAIRGLSEVLGEEDEPTTESASVT